MSDCYHITSICDSSAYYQSKADIICPIGLIFLLSLIEIQFLSSDIPFVSMSRSSHKLVLLFSITFSFACYNVDIGVYVDVFFILHL